MIKKLSFFRGSSQPKKIITTVDLFKKRNARLLAETCNFHPSASQAEFQRIEKMRQNILNKYKDGTKSEDFQEVEQIVLNQDLIPSGGQTEYQRGLACQVTHNFLFLHCVQDILCKSLVESPE